MLKFILQHALQMPGMDLALTEPIRKLLHAAAVGGKIINGFPIVRIIRANNMGPNAITVIPTYIRMMHRYFKNFHFDLHVSHKLLTFLVIALRSPFLRIEILRYFRTPAVVGSESVCCIAKVTIEFLIIIFNFNIFFKDIYYILSKIWVFFSHTAPLSHQQVKTVKRCKIKRRKTVENDDKLCLNKKAPQDKGSYPS